MAPCRVRERAHVGLTLCRSRCDGGRERLWEGLGGDWEVHILRSGYDVRLVDLKCNRDHYAKEGAEMQNLQTCRDMHD